MGDLVLLGAGGHAREILDVLSTLPPGPGGVRVVGLIDERPDARGRDVAGAPVLGDFGWFEANRYEGAVVTAVGDTALRERFARTAAGLGLRFERVISPYARVAGSASLGAGVVVFPFVFISNGVSAGDHCHFNAASSVSHDSRLGDFATLGPRATVTGRVTLGRGVTVGAGATVLPDVRVGEYSTIGAGSVVTASIEPRSVAVGSPAKIVRKTDDRPS